MSPPISDRAKMLVRYLKPQLTHVLLLACLLLSSIGLQLLNPQVLKVFIDAATHQGSDQILFFAATLFLALAVVQQVLSVSATYLSENIGWTATNALRADLLSHCLRLDPSFHKTHTPGELIERIDGDVTALANLFSQLVLQIAGNLLLLIGVLILLWRVDGRIGLLMATLVALAAVILNRVQALASPRWKIARQRSAELYGFIEERLTGAEDIRASGALPYTLRRLYERLSAHFHSERSARLTGRLVWTTSDILFTCGTAAIYLLAARLYSAHSISIGTIYIVFYYAGLIYHPLTQITRQAEDLQKATAAIARIQELLNTRSAMADGGVTPLSGEAASVHFRGVRFSYEEAAEPVIDGISFGLRPGRVLGLLGRTGSGKTTLTRLLFRLYDPQEGRILLNGVDIRDLPLADLRRHVGIVTQEVQVFSASVRDNLTFFDESISDTRMLDAIDILGLGAWYGSLPQGLDTLLASGSGGISAGEAQLLAFTRIFLRDPGLVILDEASSRLDPATEQMIERAVDRLLADRTGIIIAHRLHTVHRADEILILEHGRISEFGERDSLMRDSESHFSRLLAAGLEVALV